MAIDGEYFRYSLGVALMRYTVATGEWNFVRWVAGNSISTGYDITTTPTNAIFDSPGTGVYIYALWIINGQLSTASIVNVHSPAQIVAMVNKR